MREMRHKLKSKEDFYDLKWTNDSTATNISLDRAVP